jgi:hypothetical protein
MSRKPLKETRILPAEHFAQAARSWEASMFTFGSDDLTPTWQAHPTRAAAPDRLERGTQLPIQ